MKYIIIRTKIDHMKSNTDGVIATTKKAMMELYKSIFHEDLFFLTKASLRKLLKKIHGENAVNIYTVPKCGYNVSIRTPENDISFMTVS